MTASPSMTRRRASCAGGDEIIDKILRKDRSRAWRFAHKLFVLHPFDAFFAVDLNALWRSHLVWAKKDGNLLLELITARFATTNIFLSLLFSAEVGTYFSPSGICTQVRLALRQGPWRANKVEYATVR
jgi:hypothetical protein